MSVEPERYRELVENGLVCQAASSDHVVLGAQIGPERDVISDKWGRIVAVRIQVAKVYKGDLELGDDGSFELLMRRGNTHDPGPVFSDPPDNILMLSEGMNGLQFTNALVPGFQLEDGGVRVLRVQLSEQEFGEVVATASRSVCPLIFVQ